MPLVIEACGSNDAGNIAVIQTSTITPFKKYENAECPVPRNFLKVVDHEGGKDNMIAWADWVLPVAPTHEPPAPIQSRPPPGYNVAFSDTAGDAIDMLRDRVMKGKKCYVLDQLVTLPAHQRRGAGSMLLTWPFDRADKEGVVCYHDTEAGGKAVALYEKLGYVKVDQCETSLDACGLEGVYTHVAMIRKPKATAEIEREVVGAEKVS